MTRRCKVLGHKIEPHEIRYEQGRTLAFVGNDPEQHEVNVTWVNDEGCVREGCDCEIWWPT